MKKTFNEGNQIHNFMSSCGSGTVINYSSGSDFVTSYGSGSGSTSQKVTVPTVPVPVPVPQHCQNVRFTTSGFLIPVYQQGPSLSGLSCTYLPSLPGCDAEKVPAPQPAGVEGFPHDQQASPLRPSTRTRKIMLVLLHLEHVLLYQFLSILT